MGKALVDYKGDPLTAGSTIFCAPFRGDYPHLATPFKDKKEPDKRPWWGITAMWTNEQLENGDLDDLLELFKLVKAQDFPKGLPCAEDKFQLPWYESTEKNESPKRGYRVGMVVSALKNHGTPVKVFGPDNSDFDATKCYSGAFYRAFIRCYSYTNQKTGINFGLNGVRFERNGDPLGSSFDAGSALSKIPGVPIDNEEQFSGAAASKIGRKLGL